MPTKTHNRTETSAQRKEQEKTRRRAEQAQIVASIQTILEPNEQLLAFARGVIAGGLRGKITVGLDAFFAPFVNIALTDRRLVLQHIQPETGKHNDILPHAFQLSDLADITFTDIETFGKEVACRLTLRMHGDQYFRLRLRGDSNFESAKTLAEVFKSLTSSRPKTRTSPTQTVCSQCDNLLDSPFNFCPYCGHSQNDFVNVSSSVGTVDEIILNSFDANVPQDSNDTSAGNVQVTVDNQESSGGSEVSPNFDQAGSQHSDDPAPIDHNENPNPSEVNSEYVAPVEILNSPQPIVVSDEASYSSLSGGEENQRAQLRYEEAIAEESVEFEREDEGKVEASHEHINSEHQNEHNQEHSETHNHDQNETHHEGEFN